MEPDTLPDAPARPGAESPDVPPRRDWELWSIGLILITVLAGGLVTVIYLAIRSQEGALPSWLQLVWPLLFGLVAAVLLLNVYLIDKKRELAQLNRHIRAQEAELTLQREHAVTDSLTRVYNRRFFEEVVPKEVRRAARANRPLSVLLVDIDNFRRLNSELGHLIGDEVLRQVAESLRSTLRASDYIFRFGGDEFLVVLPETDDAGTAVVGRRLHQILAARTDLRERVGRPVTVTIGPATFLAGRTLESVIEEAEAKVQASWAQTSSG